MCDPEQEQPLTRDAFEIIPNSKEDPIVERAWLGGKGMKAGRAIKLALGRRPMSLRAAHLATGHGLLRGEEES